MMSPVTYLITKGEATRENFPQKRQEILKVVEAAVVAGISMIQIREKQLSAKQFFELNSDAAAITSSSSTKLLVNGHPEVATAAGADGVHLPEDGLPIADVRRTFPSPFLIGASVHDPDRARAAKDEGADFIVFGPVFETPEKPVKGIGALSAICAELEGFPIIAIGGVDACNSQKVLDAGAAGYAAIRYLNDLDVLKKLK